MGTYLIFEEIYKKKNAVDQKSTTEWTTNLNELIGICKRCKTVSSSFKLAHPVSIHIIITNNNKFIMQIFKTEKVFFFIFYSFLLCINNFF